MQTSQIEPPDAGTRPFWIDPVIAAALLTQGLGLLFSEQHFLGLPSWLFGSVLTTAGLGWLWYHRTERAAMTAGNRVPNAWALALIVVAMIVTGYDIYDRHYSAEQAQGTILMGYGGGGIAGACFGSINGSTLVSYSHSFDVAVVCGFEDSRIDRFQDNNVTVSAPYVIRPEGIGIQMNFSQTMETEYLKLRDQVRAAQPTDPQPTMSINTWFEVVLLPKGSAASNFQNLSDIERLGGKVLSREFSTAHTTLTEVIKLGPVPTNGKQS